MFGTRTNKLYTHFNYCAAHLLVGARQRDEQRAVEIRRVGARITQRRELTGRRAERRVARCAHTRVCLLFDMIQVMIMYIVH